MFCKDFLQPPQNRQYIPYPITCRRIVLISVDFVYIKDQARVFLCSKYYPAKRHRLTGFRLPAIGSRFWMRTCLELSLHANKRFKDEPGRSLRNPPLCRRVRVACLCAGAGRSELRANHCRRGVLCVAVAGRALHGHIGEGRHRVESGVAEPGFALHQSLSGELRRALVAAGSHYFPMVKDWLIWYLNHVNWPD